MFVIFVIYLVLTVTVLLNIIVQLVLLPDLIFFKKAALTFVRTLQIILILLCHFNALNATLLASNVQQTQFLTVFYVSLLLYYLILLVSSNVQINYFKDLIYKITFCSILLIQNSYSVQVVLLIVFIVYLNRIVKFVKISI